MHPSGSQILWIKFWTCWLIWKNIVLIQSIKQGTIKDYFKVNLFYINIKKNFFFFLMRELFFFLLCTKWLLINMMYRIYNICVYFCKFIKIFNNYTSFKWNIWIWDDLHLYKLWSTYAGFTSKVILLPNQ